MTTTTGRRTGRLTYARVAALVLPIALFNATVPLQGAIDTAMIGTLGDTVLMAAVALGASAMTMIVASFNVLQIGMSGTTAQALGAGRRGHTVDTLLRALILGLGIALLLILRGGLLALGYRAIERRVAGAR